MVAYANGQREIIKQVDNSSNTKPVETEKALAGANNNSNSYPNSYTAPANTLSIDSTID